MPSAQGRPPFHADHVGSLLRPQALRQAFRQHANKGIADAEFDKLQDQCIRDVVALQESVGLQVVTDGEFRRGSYWGRFVERTEGFSIKPASFKFRDDAGHEVEFTAPYAMNKIRRVRPLALDEFDFLRTIEAARADPHWGAPTTPITGYAFAALFYFVCCYGMSRYARSVEARLARAGRR
jgi:methionine synthase II (cobalamin-independent)